MPAVKEVMTPDVVVRPIEWSRVAYQRLPSGPAVMLLVSPFAPVYSVTTPFGVILPIMLWSSVNHMLPSLPATIASVP